MKKKSTSNLTNWYRGTALLVLLALSFVSAKVNAQQTFAANLDQYLNTHLKQGTFSGTVVVTEKGQPVYGKGFGMADYEKGIANSPEVKYRIGSVTKSFTAVMVMQLQEQGKLNVQDKVSKYLPDFPNGEKITLHQLLSNTAGIPDFVNHWQDVNTKPATTNDILALVKDMPLEFEPGTKWRYSSSGFIVLAQIIEKVTKKPYEKVLYQQILKPLKMRSTGLEFSKPIAGMALGYNHDGAERELAKYIDMSWCHAAGAMYSTSADLAKFDAALRGDKLLNQASKKQMYTPVKNNYGYGWVIDSVSKQLRISHSGAINGFKANFIRIPEREMTITILSNYESQQVNGPISRDITAIVLGDKYQMPVARTMIKMSAAQLAKYAGEYQVAPKMSFIVKASGDQLFVEVPGQDRFQIFPEAEDKFFVKVAPALVTFEKDENGQIAKMYMHHGGKAMPAMRVN
ncbi:serine hydrolase [Pontibacter cellulosilyticus]|uniref:Serine hydrolase n=1 Tax=Pontibacter cellulosilyticus TaxID=1720253 RepID=A0A923NBU2_9BACT|nr:serine hydrolase [Pontibacter cellulosilyticus]MBC5994055.1 serine hydrolase [Pontibacter cellulosilyticus]